METYEDGELMIPVSDFKIAFPRLYRKIVAEALWAAGVRVDQSILERAGTGGSVNRVGIGKDQDHLWRLAGERVKEKNIPYSVAFAELQKERPELFRK